MKKLIPADTVDSEGNVWKTVGENIRYGAKEFSIEELKSIVDILFPVGSVYCGENAFITSVGKWEQISSHVGSAILLGGKSRPSGELSTQLKLLTSETEKEQYVVIRMFRRIK